MLFVNFRKTYDSIYYRESLINVLKEFEMVSEGKARIGFLAYVDNI